ncbi:CALL3-like protein, partial [Mya arenaria]
MGDDLDEHHIEHIPEQIVEEFREAFGLFDRDGDGTISVQEFVDTLRSLGQEPSQMEIDEMIHKIDRNGDGVIDFEEFKRLMYHKMKHTDGSEEIKDFFLVLDRDSSGYFTADDLYKVITGVGEMISLEETIELVAATGTKDKGQVNYEDM